MLNENNMEEFMKEDWKDIKDYEGLYQVSNLGRIKSLSTKVFNGKGYRIKPERLLKLTCDKDGYLIVFISKGKIRKSKKVHRLVAQAFIANPEGKPQVNHIDGNKRNNRITNLEWVTNLENSIHAWQTGLQYKRFGKDNLHCKPVIQYDTQMNKINEYISIKEASRDTNISLSTIIDSCKGKIKNISRCKYIWRYSNGD